jgi:hypothetical protein
LRPAGRGKRAPPAIAFDHQQRQSGDRIADD